MTGAHTVHTQLGQSSEDALPLNDLHGGGSNSLISPQASKPPSPVENPFEPPDSATPLTGFPGGGGSGSAVMRASSPPPPTPAGGRAPEGSPFDDSAAASARPTLQATSSFSYPSSSSSSSQIPHPLASAPPPMPLDLPPPKTPPPRMRTPGATTVSSPPGRVSAPSTAHRMEQEQEGPEREHRWWTDWLCGCREEKDRDNVRLPSLSPCLYLYCSPFFYSHYRLAGRTHSNEPGDRTTFLSKPTPSRLLSSNCALDNPHSILSSELVIYGTHTHTTLPCYVTFSVISTTDSIMFYFKPCSIPLAPAFALSLTLAILLSRL